jgi:hypothetical protein
MRPWGSIFTAHTRGDQMGCAIVSQLESAVVARGSTSVVTKMTRKWRRRPRGVGLVVGSKRGEFSSDNYPDSLMCSALAPSMSD